MIDHRELSHCSAAAVVVVDHHGMRHDTAIDLMNLTFVVVVPAAVDLFCPLMLS